MKTETKNRKFFIATYMDGKFFATVTTCFPYHFALYSNIVLNCDHDTSLIALANLWFFNILDTRAVTGTDPQWLNPKWHIWSLVVYPSWFVRIDVSAQWKNADNGIMSRKWFITTTCTWQERDFLEPPCTKNLIYLFFLISIERACSEIIKYNFRWRSKFKIK